MGSENPNRFSILASQDSEEGSKLGEGKFQVRATRKCSDIVADTMSLRINLKNMMRNESLDKDFARFLRTETKSFTAELLRVDKNPDPFSPSKMASSEARIRSLKGLSPVNKEAKIVTAEEKLIKQVEDEQEISLSPGFRSSPKEIYVGASVQVLSGDILSLMIRRRGVLMKRSKMLNRKQRVTSAGPKMKAGPFASETKGNGLEAGPCDTKTELGRNEADGNATTETVQVFLKSDNLESNVCSGLVNDVENGFGLNPTKSVGEERKRFEYREHESEDASKVFVKMFKPNIQEAALSPRGDMKDKENLAHQGSVNSEAIDPVPKVGQPEWVRVRKRRNSKKGKRQDPILDSRVSRNEVKENEIPVPGGFRPSDQAYRSASDVNP
ncbi:hypothetical protein U1Q18_040487 [Sarracenia purpurea var. burkii]